MSCIADTATVDLTITLGTLSADVNVSSDTGNQLTAVANGLYVAVQVPTGVILPFSGTNLQVPTGYLFCDGTAVNRATYADLFALVGTVYGAGDTITTFNLPDMRGRGWAGLSPSGNADVDAIGENEGISAANFAYRRPKHKTTITDPGHTHPQHANTAYNDQGLSFASTNLTTGGGTASRSTQGAYTGITAGSGNANDSTDQAPFLVLSAIIKT